MINTPGYRVDRRPPHLGIEAIVAEAAESILICFVAGGFHLLAAQDATSKRSTALSIPQG